LGANCVAIAWIRPRDILRTMEGLCAWIVRYCDGSRGGPGSMNLVRVKVARRAPLDQLEECEKCNSHAPPLNSKCQSAAVLFSPIAKSSRISNRR
jgi:hypothetical protein